VRGLSVSPDGGWLLTGHADTTVHRWELEYIASAEAAGAEAGHDADAEQLAQEPLLAVAFSAGAVAVASFLAGVLAEIYLCGVSSCQEILRRNGRGQTGRSWRRQRASKRRCTARRRPVPALTRSRWCAGGQPPLHTSLGRSGRRPLGTATQCAEGQPPSHTSHRSCRSRPSLRGGIMGLIPQLTNPQLTEIYLRLYILVLPSSPLAHLMPVGADDCPPQVHMDPVTCCAFSPDGRFLATGAEDEIVRRWAVGEGEGEGQLLSVYAATFEQVQGKPARPDWRERATGRQDRAVVSHLGTGPY
jgi:WD40 repeat protein